MKFIREVDTGYVFLFQNEINHIDIFKNLLNQKIIGDISDAGFVVAVNNETLNTFGESSTLDLKANVTDIILTDYKWYLCSYKQNETYHYSNLSISNGGYYYITNKIPDENTKNYLEINLIVDEKYDDFLSINLHSTIETNETNETNEAQLDLFKNVSKRFLFLG